MEIMNDHVIKLGVCIPYLNNSKTAEELFLKLEKELDRQKKENNLDNVYIFILEDEFKVGHSALRNIMMEYFMKHKFQYILFIDADDYIDPDYLTQMYEACKMLYNTPYNVIESTFAIRNDIRSFEATLKNHVCGVCYKSSLIGDTRFDENLQIGEDTKFNRELSKKPYKKFWLNTTYHYNYGMNNQCLTYRYSRGEILPERVVL